MNPSDYAYNKQNPTEIGGIGTNMPGLFKAKAGTLLHNWGWTTEQSLKLGHRLVVRPGFEPWTFGMVTQSVL